MRPRMKTSKPTTTRIVVVVAAVVALAVMTATASAARIIDAPNTEPKFMMHSTLTRLMHSYVDAARASPVSTWLFGEREHPAVRRAKALTRDASKLKAAFEEFLDAFDKRAEYAEKTAEEYARRVEVFGENMLRAATQQANDRGSASHGVTMFSDLTPEEFAERYLGHVKMASEERAKYRETRGVAPKLPTKKLPEEFDWRFKGAVTRVKDQGMCGSCWTFSTTGAIEGAHYIATGKLVELSEQQLVDCDVGCDPDIPNACDSGCNGGLPSNAMEYIIEHGGVDTEKSYPYVGEKGECKASRGKVGATLSNFSFVDNDEEQIAAALVEYGPLSIGINAAWMQSYIGGVACPWLCDTEALDHGVLIVGYGSSGFAPVRWAPEPYWIIKNSWSPAWGEGGYYRICKDKGSCGVNNMVVAAHGVR
jgi:cathepsin F